MTLNTCKQTLTHIVSYCILALCTNLLYSQSIPKIKGQVVDSLEQPIARVLVILSKNDNEHHILQTHYSDSLGRFVFNNLKENRYMIRTSSLEYKSSRKYIDSSTAFPITLVLKPKVNRLQEVTITHKTEAAVIKKDTAVFKLSKYIREDDRRIKDLVTRLPGLYVDSSGNLYFKGKAISKLQIDNEDFFGGAVQLGIDNIPADAIEKIEIIDNVLNSNISMGSRHSETQIINLVLKEDKKNIWFGDIEAGAGYKNFYTAKPKAFYFSKPIQNHTIAGSNNLNSYLLQPADIRSMSYISSSFFRLPELIYQQPVANRFDINNTNIINNSKIKVNNHPLDLIITYAHHDNNYLEESEKFYFDTSLEENNRFTSTFSSDNAAARLSYNIKNNKKDIKLGMQFNKHDATTNENNTSTTTSVFDNQASINTSDTHLTAYTDMVFKLRPQLNWNLGLALNYDEDQKSRNSLANQSFFNDLIDWTGINTLYTIDNHVKDESQGTIIGSDLFYKINKTHGIHLVNELTYNHTHGSSTFSRDFINSIIDQVKLDHFRTQNSINYTYNTTKLEWNTSLTLDYESITGLNGVKNHQNRLNINPSINISYDFTHQKSLSVRLGRENHFPEKTYYNGLTQINDFNEITTANLDPIPIQNDIINLRYSDLNIGKHYSLVIRNTWSSTKNPVTTSYNINNQFIEESYTQIQKSNVRNISGARLIFYAGHNNYEIGIKNTFNKSYVLLDELEQFKTNQVALDLKWRSNPKKPHEFIIGTITGFNTQRTSNIYSDFTSLGYSVEHTWRINKKWKIYSHWFQQFYNNTRPNQNLGFNFTYQLKNIDLSVNGNNILGREEWNNRSQNQIYRSATTRRQLGRQILLKGTYYF